MGFPGHEIGIDRAGYGLGMGWPYAWLGMGWLALKLADGLGWLWSGMGSAGHRESMGTSVHVMGWS